MTKYNNCVKVQFEIGHEASVRSEVTAQGFTHDWQVFVRGADNAEIHHFVEKVVFNLHNSFPKPKRVVKEPPYEVRESGYASFTFPIEVYLKSKDEPRKLDFMYDLSLNTNGPIRISQREKRIFSNPSEEFRRKLIRGGGVGVGSDSLLLTDNNSQNADDKSSSRKSSGDSSKKHKSKDSLKSEDVRSSNQFADLFGTPIHKTAKLSPTTAPKKGSESKHSSDGKVSSKSASKHSPHKEKEKDKEGNKKDTMLMKEKEKDRERSKEKEKKTDKSLKRPPSPIQPHTPTKVIKEEPKKTTHDDFKEKEKIKLASSEISKNEKKEKKKDKKSRDEKDKKDRHKDYESKKEPAPAPTPAPPPSLPTPPPIVEKEKIIDKPDKIKPDFKDVKELKDVKRSPKHIVKEEKLKEKVEKEKTESVEKQRHKHKKKEKNKKEEKELKEKSIKKVEKLPPAPPVVPKEPSPPPQPPPSKSKVRSPSPKMSKTNPLGALLSELPSDKGSDSESSGDEDAKSVEKIKMTLPPAPAPPVTRTPERVKEKEKVKKKDKKGSSKGEEGPRKRKRKSKEKEEVVSDKISKIKVEEDHKIIRIEVMDEDIDDRLSEPSMVGSPQREDPEISRSRSPTPPTKFTEEYVMELKDLQQKIMTLEDNAELQRVVQVIAETGQYEITKKTFDFDLCALDKSTVKRLQDLFFAAS